MNSYKGPSTRSNSALEHKRAVRLLTELLACARDGHTYGVQPNVSGQSQRQQARARAGSRLDRERHDNYGAQ